MELIFLGTSAGAPTKSRNVSALAIKKADSKAWYLIDCGEGTQHQLLHTSLALGHLRAVFITHIHGDHCYGLVGLLATASMAGRRAPLDIIAPVAIQHLIEQIQSLTELHLSFEVRFHSVEQGADFNDRDFQVKSVPLSHRVPSFAYQFEEKVQQQKLDIAKLKAEGIPQGEIWGQLQQQRRVTLSDGLILTAADYLLSPRAPRTVIIAGDNDSPDVLKTAANKAQVLVHEATYTRVAEEKAGGNLYGHSTAERVALFAEQVALANVILTHFSPRYRHNPSQNGLSIEEIRQEAQQYYQGRLFLAEDFAHYHLDTEGVLSLKSPE